MKQTPDFGFLIFDFGALRSKLLWLIVPAVWAGGCSIPNLENADCADARTAVRQFYSFHIGNDMKPSAENLKLREKFLTPALLKDLSARADNLVDYFTATDDFPKAFRVGRCRVSVPGQKVSFQILLFWKTDTRTEQREIRVEAERLDGNWLINKVDDNK